ncbi:uncharacterized protein LOC124678617 [Lolium rigidum]|uniref:uncharacterized protein LOC124678617 n=1 Tax=Lolium rigidum TaxID=89674 RepID=UPI001F5C8DC0|nr:uncharacterized protein LOC124678617 [Lolium rigidum]
MRQDLLLLLFGEMMVSVRYLQSWPTATKIELVDVQDCYELAYGLVMPHQWHTLSKFLCSYFFTFSQSGLSTERMSSEAKPATPPPPLQHHHHLCGFQLMHGQSLGLANNVQYLKFAQL